MNQIVMKLLEGSASSIRQKGPNDPPNKPSIHPSIHPPSIHPFILQISYLSTDFISISCFLFCFGLIF